MFTIKTYLKESSIHGIGCFSSEFVKSGSIVWKFVENFDIRISDINYNVLPNIAKDFISNFGYYNKNEGGYILCSDNAKFTNHSINPNIILFDNTSTIALKDINIDDEITENYFNFDEHAKIKLA